MLHLVSETSYLSLHQPHSGTSSFISDSPIPSPITSSSSDSPLYKSITPSLTASLKPTCFTNPNPVVSLLPPGLPSHSVTCHLAEVLDLATPDVCKAELTYVT